MAGLLFFLYGLAAGFLVMRLRKRRAMQSPPGRALWIAAWLTMAMSFALAALLGASLIWELLNAP